MASKDELDDFKKGLRIGIWDIETTGLNADYGYVFCVCILNPITKERYTFRIDDKRNPNPYSDKWVIQEAIKCLNTFDLLVGWYTTRFDHVFIDTRAMKYNLKPMDRNFRRDLWYTSRFKMKLRSNSLKIVAEYFFGKSCKNRIDPDTWNAGIRGEKWALDYIVGHCQLDLNETLRVYKKMLPLIPKRLRKL